MYRRIMYYNDSIKLNNYTDFSIVTFKHLNNLILILLNY